MLFKKCRDRSERSPDQDPANVARIKYPGERSLI